LKSKAQAGHIVIRPNPLPAPPRRLGVILHIIVIFICKITEDRRACQTANHAACAASGINPAKISFFIVSSSQSFPMIGKWNRWFFQALESETSGFSKPWKTSRKFSKPWKCFNHDSFSKLVTASFFTKSWLQNHFSRVWRLTVWRFRLIH
jgi:hypothetical protein